jgi:predicted site-specific integrase-resolvase
MYVKAAEYAKWFTVNPQTLRRWADAGKIQYRWSPGGIRLYELPDSAHGGDGQQPKQQPADEEKKVVYARVSSAKQKDDLQRQADFLLSKFPNHQLVTDIGSGINWRRKGLLSLLDTADQGALAEVVVASRDRLCRFAFELLEHVFRGRGVRLVVLDSADQCAQQELSDDLLSIVQVFCCRRNGKRRYAGSPDGCQDPKDQAEPDAGPKATAKQVCRRR